MSSFRLMNGANTRCVWQAESIMQAAGDDARLYGKAAIRYVALGAYCNAGVAQKSQSDRRWWLDAV